MGLLRACLMEVRAYRKDWDSAPAAAFPPSVAEACATIGVAALKCVLDALDAPCAAPQGEGPGSPHTPDAPLIALAALQPG